MKIKNFIITAVLMFGLLPAGSILAQDKPTEEKSWLVNIGVESKPGANDGMFIPSECTDSKPQKETPCTLNSAFQLIINFTQILLALTGSVAILMFVYGGTMMIIGGVGGDQAKGITAGKDAIKASVIGLAVILGAWLVVNFTILAITQGAVGGVGQIFGRDFNQQPSSAPGDSPKLDENTQE